MRRTLTVVLTVCLGLGLLALGVVVGLASPPTAASGVPDWLGALLVLLVLAFAAWKLLRNPRDADAVPAPWTDAGALAETRPEETPDTDRISGTAFTETIESAAELARSEQTVEAGLVAVREPLRETLVGVLRQGGWDDERIDDALASGSWTDDPVAAAVVDERVAPPVRPLRRRVWAWLFPQKAVRHRSARAVGAIATAADAALPPVVGQRAPRPVPIVEPTVEDLQRAADGSLRRAVDGRASVRVPEASERGEKRTAAAGGAGEPDDGETPPSNESTDEPDTDDTDGEWTVAGGDD